MKVYYRSLFTLLLASLLYSCSTNNVHVRKEWKKYFSGNGVTGCFMLHNTMLNTFEIYSLGGTQKRIAPLATFDIMNAMVGLETGVITDTDMVIKDSLNHPVKGVDPSLTMGDAFRSSNLPYFQKIAQRTGAAKMQFWIDSVKYGNKIMGTRIDSFWMDNTLQVSADEQMGLLEGLFTKKLPFQDRTQRLVKSLMLRKETPNYRMNYLACSGREGKEQLGWVVGWIYEAGHPHFFTMNMETSDTSKNLRATGLKILHHILDEEGYFKKR